MNDDHITIPLTRGLFTVVSKEDEDLAAYKWQAAINVTIGSSRPYAHRAQTSKVFPGMMHKIIMTRIVGAELPPYQIIDHKDNNPLNNTRENLRLATPTESARNRRRDSLNPSGYKGVIRTKTGKFSAQITVDKKRVYLGQFDNPEEAHEAYCKAAKEYFGEFARYE